MLPKFWMYAGIALAAIAAYFGWKTKVRSDAKDEERAKQQQKVVDAAHERQKIDQRVSTSTDDELDKLLQPPGRK